MGNAIARAPGRFCPDAAVRCLTCAGVAARTAATAAAGEGDGPGTCDDCGAPVWVREDVAELQAAVQAVNTAVRGYPYARLEQTGGMCCALRVDVDDCDGVKTYLLATPDEEVVDEGLLVVCMYFESSGDHSWVDMRGVKDVGDLVQLVKLLAPLMPLSV